MVPLAKKLRADMTKEERHLWYDFLRAYPVRFTRQKIIGNYIVDFYCPQAKIVLELDGSQHYEEENLQKDAERTRFLKQFDLRVIRIPNSEINRNFRGVCEYIDAAVKGAVENYQRK
jgi:very-short-patch-repair endonuclease